MRVENNKEWIQLEVLGYEYPPGWGAGMPFETDWLNVRLSHGEGDQTRVLEDTLLKFSELRTAYEEITQILEGSQSGYWSDFTDPRYALSVEVIEDRDIFVEMGCRMEEEDYFVRQEVTSEGFRQFVQELEDILVSNYRPNL